ncbi:MAG: erythromycin esterase family protein, partial [Acidobacteriota bacterium]|nr:erythromycin esterase family protein [Acidobacteriota bacterium]
DDPAADDSELSKFGEQLGNAQVVGLGEPTHGSREIFRIKHRLFSYLVRNKGFRSFAMEADGAAACDLDRYVRTGEGDPDRLIRELKFWTWKTQEVRDLVLWMRAYNRSVGPEEAVSFHGLDMQIPAHSSRRVSEYFNRVDKAAADRAAAAYRCLGDLEHRLERSAEELDPYSQKPVEDQLSCAHRIAEVRDEMVRLRTRYERQEPSGYACALLSANLMVEAEALLKFPFLRDRFYVENLLALLGPSGTDAKVAVWAHNAHVANVPDAMGAGLKRRLGARYAAVASTFYEGTFRAKTAPAADGKQPAVTSILAPPPRADSYEEAFHRAGFKRFFLGLAAARTGDVAADWLMGSHPMRQIGGTFHPALANSPTRLAVAYDFVVFFDRAQSSRPLPPAAPPN